LLFVIALYSSMLNLLIQLALLFYFVLYPVWFTSPPQDPTIRSSAAQRTAGTFVPVLGSTPSAAALLVSYGLNISASCEHGNELSVGFLFYL